MRKLVYVTLFLLFSITGWSQNITGPAGYRVVSLGDNGQGDYTRSLILLHEIYNGNLLQLNNVVGTITAFRGSPGAYLRMDMARLNTSSAYNSVLGNLSSEQSTGNLWKLKTCNYNGKKYLAVEIPYADSFHDQGYQFEGWANSSGECLKCVNYMINGQPVNQSILTDIQDFTSNLVEYHDVPAINITGAVGIGTTDNHGFKLAVNGNVRAKEIKVEAGPWPDYVFKPDYHLTPLNQVANYVSKNGHLPGIPSEQEVMNNGVNLGDINRLLLQKVEELTLYLIDKDKKYESLQREVKQMKKTVQKISKHK